MTLLTEEFRVLITLRHDDAEPPSTAYGGPTNLHEAIPEVWEIVGASLRLMRPGYKARLTYRGIEAEWSYSGKQEDHEGGDN